MIPAAHPPFSTSPSCCRMQLSGPLRPSVCAEAGVFLEEWDAIKQKTRMWFGLDSWFIIDASHWDKLFVAEMEMLWLSFAFRWVRALQFWCAQSSRNISNIVCLPTHNQGFLPRMKGFPTLQASSPSTLGSGATATEASQWRDDIWIAWRPRCKPSQHAVARLHDNWGSVNMYKRRITLPHAPLLGIPNEIRHPRRHSIFQWALLSRLGNEVPWLYLQGFAWTKNSMVLLRFGVRQMKHRKRRNQSLRPFWLS